MRDNFATRIRRGEETRGMELFLDPGILGKNIMLGNVGIVDRGNKRGDGKGRNDAGKERGQRREGTERKNGERGRKREFTPAIYSNLTLDSMALNNRPRLRRNWSPFNNGLLSNELVLSAKRARLGWDITPGKSVL